MQVTIIGAGNMGRGIGTRALAGGHSVRLIDKDPAKAKALAEELRQRVAGDVAESDSAAVGEADIVVLALPFPAGKDVAARYGEQLAGKTVVDICNPVDFATFDSLVVPPGTSAAEQIAAAAPGARVVKAFNTTFAGNLVAAQGSGVALDVFIAGDDAAAKQAVADLAATSGMRPIDAGPLRRARELEGMQFLHMTMQQTLGTNWSSAIKILGLRPRVWRDLSSPASQGRADSVWRARFRGR